MAKVKTRFKETAPRHHIRAWRKFRNLTMEQLAERVGVTHGAISQLERGIMNYTQPMLEALAEALHCAPGDLIMRDPSVTHDMWTIWEMATPAERNQIEAVSTAIIEAKKRA